MIDPASTEPTAEQVRAAYAAMATGDRAEIVKHYHEDVRWLVPGNHRLAGWYEGLDAFLGLMAEAGKSSGGSFAMELLNVMTGDGCSADVCHNTARRAGTPADSESAYDRLDAPVFHFMRWSGGRIVEGRDGLFGDDATAFNQFWSPLSGGGARISD